MTLLNEQDVEDRDRCSKAISEQKMIAFKEIQQNPGDRLGVIKKWVGIALNWACETVGSCYKEYLQNPAVKDRFLKVITSFYLQKWLDADPEAGRNINAFYNHGYAPEVVRITRDCPNQEIEPFPFSYETLIRAKQKYEIYEGIILKQAKAEHRYYKEGEEEEQSTRQHSYAHKIPWEKLCIIAKMAEGKLRIIDFLIEPKDPLIKGSLPKSNQYLKECYQDYYNLYRRLDPEIENKEQMTDIEYVASAIMLQEMEYSHRFHAAVLMAKMVRGSYPSFNFDTYKDEALLFYGRFAEAEYGSIKPTIINNDRDLVFAYTSHDILSYQDEMHYLCYCEERGRTEADDCLSSFPQTRKGELLYERQALLFLVNIIPPSEMPEWREEDYHNARCFFEREYPIYQVYRQTCTKDGKLDLGDVVHKRKCDTAYDSIREFLTWLIKTSEDEEVYAPESPDREDIHDTLCEFRKKRYTPSRTKRGRPPKGR